MGTQAALTLSTIVPDRVLVSITSEMHPDGRLYELRKGNELSISALQEIASLGEKAESLEAKEKAGELTIEDAQLLDDFTTRVLELIFHTHLEDEVRDGLTQEQRLEVVALFTTTSLETAPRAQRRATTKKPARKRTGAK